MMKRILAALLILTAALSCKREAPRATEPFLITFRMPEECMTSVKYKNRRVYFNGNLSYQFVTDAAGKATVEDLVPGIYDIVTNWEMSGADYKALLKDSDIPLKDNAQVIVGVSLMGQRLFTPEDMEVDLSAAVVQGLMISKVYYSGTKDDLDKTYTTDSYIEIFNNSDEVIYIDGWYLGLTESVSPAAYPAKDDPEHVYLRQVCQFPGNGATYPVQPGGQIVVATKSARDHTQSAKKSVDLSGADFEVKVSEGSGNPDVPMMPIVYNSLKIQYMNLLSGGPNGVVLFETEEDINTWPKVYQPGLTSGEMFLVVDKEVISDGVECLKKPAQTDPDVNTKRLQKEIDAGYININAVNGYNHESVERKVTRENDGRYYLKDTNNSSVDLAVCTDPTPRKYDKEGLL